MSGARIGLAALLTLLAQVALVPHIAIADVRPDATLLLLVFLSLRRGPIVGTLVGFVLGGVQDILVPETLGMHMLAKSITGYVIGRLGRGMVLSGPVVHAILVALAVLMHDILFLLAYLRLDLLRIFPMFFTRTLPMVVYTVALGQAILLATHVIGGGTRFGAGEEGHAG